MEGEAEKPRDGLVPKLGLATKENSTTLTENEIAKQVVDAAFHVHKTLGPGLLESVYEIVLAHELRQRGLQAERQVAIPIKYESIQFDEGFRADIVVEEKVIVETEIG